MLSMSANLVTKTEPHVTMFCAYGLFSNSLLWLWSEMLVAQSCPTLCNPMDRSPPCSLAMEISRQEYRNGLSFPSPGDLPNPETDPISPVLQADRLPSEPPGRLILCLYKVSWGEVTLILSVSNTTSNLVALRGYNARFPPTCVPFLLVPFIPWLSTENTKLLISCLALPLCPNHFLLWFFYFYSQYHHSSSHPGLNPLCYFHSFLLLLIHALHGSLYPSYPFHSHCHHSGWGPIFFPSLSCNNSHLLSLYHFSLLPWLCASLLTNLKWLNIAYSSQQTFTANLIVHNTTLGIL